MSVEEVQGAPSRHGASAPWDRTLESWNPVMVFVLCAAGAAGGVLLLLAGATRTEHSEQFVQSSGFTVWAAVIAAQTAVWAVLTVPVWREAMTLYRQTRPSWTIWVVPGLVVLALLLLLVLSPAGGFDWPLVGHRVKSALLTGAAALGVGVPAVFAISLVQDGVRRHPRHEMTTAHVNQAVEARAQMRRLLSAAGAIIGLAVLAAGALQRATVPTFISEAEYPPTAILLYGAFFTGLLVLVWLPAHLSLRRFCLDVRESFYPQAQMPSPTSDEFAGWVDARNRLDTLTQVNVSASQQLQASLFILAPLISAILGALLPKV
jgi:hypothetical protein